MNLMWTPRAQRVLERASSEAMKRGSDYIGTEDILVALVCEDGGVSARVLQNLGIEIDAEKVRSEIRLIVGPPMPCKACGK